MDIFVVDLCLFYNFALVHARTQFGFDSFETQIDGLLVVRLELTRRLATLLVFHSARLLLLVIVCIMMLISDEHHSEWSFLSRACYHL